MARDGHRNDDELFWGFEDLIFLIAVERAGIVDSQAFCRFVGEFGQADRYGTVGCLLAYAFGCASLAGDICNQDKAKRDKKRDWVLVERHVISCSNAMVAAVTSGGATKQETKTAKRGTDTGAWSFRTVYTELTKTVTPTLCGELKNPVKIGCQSVMLLKGQHIGDILVRADNNNTPPVAVNAT